MDEVQKELANARLVQAGQCLKSYVLERLERLDEAHIVNDGITDYEDGEIVDGKKTLKKMRDKYGV